MIDEMARRNAKKAHVYATELAARVTALENAFRAQNSDPVGAVAHAETPRVDCVYGDDCWVDAHRSAKE